MTDEGNINSSFATLGLVSVVAIVGVVGIVTLLPQEGSTDTVPVSTAQPTTAEDQGNTAGDATMRNQGPGPQRGVCADELRKAKRIYSMLNRPCQQVVTRMVCDDNTDVTYQAEDSCMANLLETMGWSSQSQPPSVEEKAR